MSFANALEIENLNYLFRATAMTLNVDPYYLALSTADPGETGGSMAEPSGGAYARQSIAKSAAGFTAATGTPTQVTNAAQINFPEASASWGTVTHWALFTAVTAGTFILSGSMDASKTIDIGDILQFAIGALKIRLD